MPFATFLSQLQSVLSMSYFGFSVLDVVIIAVVVFYAFEGYGVGVINACLDLASFVISFAVGLKFYGFVSAVLVSTFFMPQGFAHAIGFFVTAFAVEVILNILSRVILTYYPPRFDFGRLQKPLGVIPAVFSALILLSFLLTLIVSLPLAPFLKQVVLTSRVGNMLLVNTAGFEKKMNEIFGQAANETINFLTVKPQSDEFVKLTFQTSQVTIDAQSEGKMFELLNNERLSRGLKPLTFSTTLRDVGRLHSKDMFERGYFSHYTPDGTSPFDRMTIANIVFTKAGENLALAPSVDLAMHGLMNSPGHKANILSTAFGRVGIGVIDGGIYGKMFSQEFTD